MEEKPFVAVLFAKTIFRCCEQFHVILKPRLIVK